MGFYGTETKVITGLGLVTYWIKGCDPTFGNVTSPVTDDTIPPVIYTPKLEVAAQSNKTTTTIVAVVVTILGILVLITAVTVSIICYKKQQQKHLVFKNKLVPDCENNIKVSYSELQEVD